MRFTHFVHSHRLKQIIFWEPSEALNAAQTQTGKSFTLKAVCSQSSPQIWNPTSLISTVLSSSISFLHLLLSEFETWSLKKVSGTPHREHQQQHRKLIPAELTEIFECLFDLLGCQVETGVHCDEGSVQPVIMVVAVDRVGPQAVHWQLLL